MKIRFIFDKRIFLLKVSMIMLFCLLGTMVSGAQPLLDQPTIKSGFRLGELLEYNVKVKGIPAGTQTMQIKDKRFINGREVYHLESRSLANKFFYVLYPFDDQSQSFILKDGFYPLRYIRNLTDGRYIGNMTVDIDENKRIAKIIKDRKKYEVNIPKGIQDELSMLYLIRTKDLEIGQDYEFSVVIGTKIFKVKVEVLRKEKIKTILGTKETLVIKSIPNNALLWITQDEDRIPVKLEVSTRIGKLVAELKAIS